MGVKVLENERAKSTKQVSRCSLVLKVVIKQIMATRQGKAD